MTPVAFALFIIALVWPLQRRLQAVLPQVVAVLVTAAVALLAIGGGGWLVVWGFGGIAQWVIANAARLQGLYMHAADLLEQRGLYAAELFAEQVNVLWLVQILRGIGGSLQVLEVLEETTAAPEQVTEAIRINTEGRSRALRICFLALTGLALVAIFPAGDLPGYDGAARARRRR